jgi:hypothetical protein
VYIIAAAAIVGSIGTMLCRTPPPHNAIKSHTANANATSAAAADGVLARWRAKRLLVGSAVYFAVAPTLTLAIGVLWVKNGDVFGSSEVRNEEEGEEITYINGDLFGFLVTTRSIYTSHTSHTSHTPSSRISLSLSPPPYTPSGVSTALRPSSYTHSSS